MKKQLPKHLIIFSKCRARTAFNLTLVIVIFSAGLAACNLLGLQNDAVKVVERYLEAKKRNDYSAWISTLWAAQKDPQDFSPSFERPGYLGVLSLSIQSIAISDKETERIKKMVSGSDLAKRYGWSNEDIGNHIIAVIARYSVDYDNAKVPYPEGTITQTFYLVRDNLSSPWLIWDFGFPAE